MIVLSKAGSEFDPRDFFASIEQSGARALLIGRQALIALGLPLVTADYDFWIHVDDIALVSAIAQESERHSRPRSSTRG